MSALLVTAALAALVLPPALLLAGPAAREGAGLEALTQSLAVALAGLLILLHLAAHVSVRLGAALALAASLVALVAWLRGGRGFPWRAGDGLLAAVLAVVAAPRLALALFHELPPGGDPAFHLVLARLVQEGDVLIRDWRPFEDLALHYPLGSHVLLAALGDVSRQPLHDVFGPLLAGIGTLCAAQVHALVVRLGGTRRHAVASALAFGAWAAWGSIDVGRWGGLPNQLGLALLLAALTALCGARCSKVDAMTAAVALAAIVVTHHHAALVTALVMLPLFAWVAWVRRDAPRARLMAWAGAGGALLAAPALIPQLLSATNVGGTSVMRVVETLPTWRELPLVLGPMLLAASIWGAVLLLLFRRDALPLGRSWIVVPLAVMLPLYVACGPVYQAIMGSRFGEPVTFMTASRFLTDAAPFLAVLAGLAWTMTCSGLRFPPPAEVGVGLLLGLTCLPTWRQQMEPGPPAGFVRACRMVDERMPDDTYVFTGEPWATYLCWRRTGRTPMPVSEPATFPPRRGEINSEIRAGIRPLELRHARIVRLGPPGSAGPRERVLWEADGWAVIEMLTDE